MWTWFCNAKKKFRWEFVGAKQSEGELARRHAPLINVSTHADEFAHIPFVRQVGLNSWELVRMTSIVVYDPGNLRIPLHTARSHEVLWVQGL